jgi:hypothetical protein
VGDIEQEGVQAVHDGQEAGPVRVLVTGSRDWSDRGILRAALDQLLAEHGPTTVVHGACPPNADALADQWAHDTAPTGVLAERHPADWRPHGRSAGFIRYAAIVAAGADLVLAFFDPGATNRGVPRTAAPRDAGRHRCAPVPAATGTSGWRGG